MFWIVIAIFSYFLLAITAIGDKFLLSGKPSPKSYTFFTNIPGILLVLLIPLVGFVVPDLKQILFGLIVAVSSVLGSFLFYTALKRFESSRIIPAVGAFLPIFVFLIPLVIFQSNIVFTLADFIAFSILILGSVLISAEKGKGINSQSLFLSLFAALSFALTFVFSKRLFSELPFWTVMILTRAGATLFALLFLFTKEVRLEFRQKDSLLQKKTGLLFLAVQSAGVLAGLSQNLAVALAPLGYLAFVNALEGTRYIFLLGMSVLLLKKFPGVFKEDISRSTLFQKAVAIAMIIVGLVIFTVFSKN